MQAEKLKKIPENIITPAGPKITQLSRNMIFQIVKYLPFVFISIIVIAPLIMIIFISFKSADEYTMTLPFMPPTRVMFQNYFRAFNEGHLLAALINSFILVFLGSLGSVLIGTMTAYCLNRFDFFFKKYIKFLYVASFIIPGALLQVVVYQLLKMFNLTGTFGAPVLLYISTDIIQVWIYLQFMENISYSLDESAMLDGASYFRIFGSIVLPLLTPATATVLILKSVTIYNDMFTQYLYMSSSKLMTATTALMFFSGQFANTFNIMAAGIIIVMIPTVVMFLLLQKRIFAGITVGAIKE